MGPVIQDVTQRKRMERMAGYFNVPDERWTDRDRLIRAFEPNDVVGLLEHVGDIIANLDMMLISARDLLAPDRKRHDPPEAKSRLIQATLWIGEIAGKVERAIDLAR